MQQNSQVGKLLPVERFYNLYGYIFACLDAKNTPTGYPNLQKAGVPHDDWCWDTPTRIKTEGLKQSLATSKNILSLIVLLHGLDLSKEYASNFRSMMLTL